MVVKEEVLIKDGKLGWKIGEVECWVGDKIEVNSLLHPENRYRGKVVFEIGCFSLLIEKVIEEEHPEYEKNQIVPLAEFNLDTVRKITL
jgi:hypothetical protein